MYHHMHHLTAQCGTTVCGRFVVEQDTPHVLLPVDLNFVGGVFTVLARGLLVIFPLLFVLISPLTTVAAGFSYSKEFPCRLCFWWLPEGLDLSFCSDLVSDLS